MRPLPDEQKRAGERSWAKVRWAVRYQSGQCIKYINYIESVKAARLQLGALSVPHYKVQPLPSMTASLNQSGVAAIAWPSTTREQQFHAWLASLPVALGLQTATLASASADASFRRYFRLQGAEASYIIMDAPPDKEDCAPFVAIAERLIKGGVHAPRVIAQDLQQGFLLLSDLGATTFLAALQTLKTQAQAQTLYLKAIATLVRVQTVSAEGLPPYNHDRLVAEMRLFDEWYVPKHLKQTLSEAEAKHLSAAYELIASRNCAEAQVLVHRDFHSRNLMVASSDEPLGVLDFQDAVSGPISYDLASLLRDAYVEWTEEQQLDWAVRYWQQARAAGLPVPDTIDAFYQNFEWMGLQRHLKVLGIFARLCHRDGKDGYLKDLPLVAKYALAVCRRYDELAPLGRLLMRLHGIQQQTGITF
jgi:N-acetylmuramate 1-kinase